MSFLYYFFFFKQKTAYERRISDWSSDVCSSDLLESFAGLGLKASGGAMAIGDFMRPGVVAATGIDAAQPLLDASADLVGPVGLFTNFVQIMILLIAWVIVVLAFFVLAVQVFVTILEFK